MEAFLFNKHKIALKPTIHQNSAVPKASSGKCLNHWSYMSILSPENYGIPRRHRLLGQTTKQPLSNFVPQKPGKYKQLWGWGLTLVAYKKISEKW